MGPGPAAGSGAVRAASTRRARAKSRHSLHYCPGHRDVDIEQLQRSCGGTAAAKAASTESSRQSTTPRSRRAPPPPLACFVLRRLRRLDSVLGDIAVDLKQFQFQVRSGPRPGPPVSLR